MTTQRVDVRDTALQEERRRPNLLTVQPWLGELFEQRLDQGSLLNPPSRCPRCLARCLG